MAFTSVDRIPGWRGSKLDDRYSVLSRSVLNGATPTYNLWDALPVEGAGDSSEIDGKGD